MKTIFTILLGLILTNYTYATKSIISGTVIASPSTASALVTGDTLLITGSLVLNSDYTVHANNDITVQVDGGSIVWNGNYTFSLGVNSYLYLFNGASLVNGIGSCNANKRIRFGTIDIVSCNGGGGVGTYSFGTFNSMGGGGASGPLPVELVSFDAKRLTNQAIQISWTTASELNNAGFEVERSDDGVNFDVISTVDGTNTNQVKTYAVIDNAPTSKVAYYRLKQIDNNMTFSYSNTVKLASVSSLVKPVVGLYPNPNQGVFTVQFNATYAAELETKIYDLNGSLVSVNSIQSHEGDNTVKMNFESLPSGTYMVAIQIDNQTCLTKFQKL